MTQMFRQGDVLLVECELPDNALALSRPRPGGIILAAGEATGHHHRIKDRHTRLFGTNARVTGQPRRTFIKTCKHGATVTHEEHDPLQLPASKTFEVVRQREYQPPKDQRSAPRTSYVFD